jgi:hypothetical protein
VSLGGFHRHFDLSFKSPMLKLAPACIGGCSMKLGMCFAITCAEVW